MHRLKLFLFVLYSFFSLNVVVDIETGDAETEIDSVQIIAQLANITNWIDCFILVAADLEMIAKNWVLG